MKRLVFFLILNVFSLSSFAQFYLGLSTNEAKRQIQANAGVYTQIKTAHSSDGTISFGWTEDLWDGVLFFNHEGFSNMFVMIPKNQVVMNTTIQNFNEKYVVVSNTQWKVYSRGATYQVDLIYVKSFGKYAFYVVQIDDRQ